MNICEFCRLERVICPFSQSFTNQFQSYLVDRCKIYYWAFFLLCVVFNFQYFMRYSEKNWFLTIFIHFFMGRNSLVYFSIDLIFCIQMQDILINFFCSLSTIELSIFSYLLYNDWPPSWIFVKMTYFFWRYRLCLWITFFHWHSGACIPKKTFVSQFEVKRYFSALSDSTITHKQRSLYHRMFNFWCLFTN